MQQRFQKQLDALAEKRERELEDRVTAKVVQLEKQQKGFFSGFQKKATAEIEQDLILLQEEQAQQAQDAKEERARYEADQSALAELREEEHQQSMAALQRKLDEVERREKAVTDGENAARAQTDAKKISPPPLLAANGKQVEAAAEKTKQEPEVEWSLYRCTERRGMHYLRTPSTRNQFSERVGRRIQIQFSETVYAQLIDDATDVKSKKMCWLKCFSGRYLQFCELTDGSAGRPFFTKEPAASLTEQEAEAKAKEEARWQAAPCAIHSRYRNSCTRGAPVHGDPKQMDYQSTGPKKECPRCHHIYCENHFRVNPSFLGDDGHMCGR